MEIKALVDQMEFYAVNCKDINHVIDGSFNDRAFFNLDFEELSNAIREGCKFPLILCLTPEIEKSALTDSLSEAWSGQFMVLTKGKKIDAVNQCKVIADKFFNRMLADAGDFFDSKLHQTDEGIIGPTTDLLYGWLVGFSFDQAYNGEVLPNDWEDLS